MRFMMLMLPGDFSTPVEEMSVEAFRAMGRYNEELEKAGVLLDLGGLHPPSEGVRVSLKAGKPTVTDGPYAEAKELVGGYWIIQAKSLAEAIEWASRVPLSGPMTVEVRQLFEFSDFPAEVQATAGDFPEMKARRARLTAP